MGSGTHGKARTITGRHLERMINGGTGPSFMPYTLSDVTTET